MSITVSWVESYNVERTPNTSSCHHVLLKLHRVSSLILGKTQRTKLLAIVMHDHIIVHLLISPLSLPFVCEIRKQKVGTFPTSHILKKQKRGGGHFNIGLGRQGWVPVYDLLFLGLWVSMYREYNPAMWGVSPTPVVHDHFRYCAYRVNSHFWTNAITKLLLVYRYMYYRYTYIYISYDISLISPWSLHFICYIHQKKRSVPSQGTLGSALCCAKTMTKSTQHPIMDLSPGWRPWDWKEKEVVLTNDTYIYIVYIYTVTIYIIRYNNMI